MEQTLIGHTLTDPDGGPIGKITDVIVDPTTLEPEFLTVKTGRLGGERLVPVAAVQADDGTVQAPFDKGTVKDAPSVDKHTSPAEPEREALYRHYRMPMPEPPR